MTVKKYARKRGSTVPVIARTLTRADGSAIDLTGKSVTFVMDPAVPDRTDVRSSRRRFSGAPYLAKPAVVTDAENGEVEFRPGSDDLDDPGLFWIEWEIVDDGSGASETIPEEGYDVLEVGADLNP